MSKRLTKSDYEDVAKENDLEVAHIKAVVSVESLGKGFNSFGSPIILFEGHKFHKYTDGKYSDKKEYEDISYPKWTKKWYTGTQKGEYERLKRASKLDLEAALKSTSWGMFQIMGFNHDLVGYKTVTEMVTAMETDEREQLEIFIRFIKNVKSKGKTLLEHLRDKNWSEFAYKYNGSGQVDFYANKLKKAYHRLKK